jgi:hypothetical protein
MHAFAPAPRQTADEVEEENRKRAAQPPAIKPSAARAEPAPAKQPAVAAAAAPAAKAKPKAAGPAAREFIRLECREGELGCCPRG